MPIWIHPNGILYFRLTPYFQSIYFGRFKDRAHLSTFKFFILEKFSCIVVLIVFFVIVQSSGLTSVWFREKITFFLNFISFHIFAIYVGGACWGLPAACRLTHWGRATHICVGKLTTIGSDNGLSPGRRQPITWTNVGILLIEPLGTNFSEILIEIHTFSFKKIHLKIAAGKWRPFCLGLNVLIAVNGARLPSVDGLTVRYIKMHHY